MEENKKKIALSSPTLHGEEKIYMNEAYDSNWIAFGENLIELENMIRNRIGVKAAVALSSGTSALHLAVKLAGVKPGDVVFAQSLTFDASVNPVLYEHGVPVFIDSEYDSWNMDPKALEKAFEKYPECKTVITVNLYGTPCKLDEIRAICDRHGAVLIEDAAESLGATYKGKSTGSFGRYSAISFNGNKIITTSGGGMLLSDDEEAIQKARKWSTQARDKAPWYQHSELGYNYRLSNVLAGIGRGQFLHLDEHITLKKKIYERYKEGLKDLPVEMNPYLECSEPIFWLSCLLIRPEGMCRQVRGDLDYSYEAEAGKSCPEQIREILEENHVETRPIWKPMHLQPLNKERDFINLGKDVAADVFSRGLCLPSDIKMSEEEQNKVIRLIRNCFR